MKELKEKLRIISPATEGLAWNPVKELKEFLDNLGLGVVQSRVESGEGIESITSLPITRS